MIDPKRKHQIDIMEADKKIDALKKEYPDTYFNHKEFRKLSEIKRQAYHNIEHYQRMIDRGVKF